MSKLPTRRVLLSAAILSTMVLAGCEVDTEDSRPVARTVPGTPSPAIPGCTIVDTATGACAWILTHPDADGVGGPDYFIPGTHPRFNPAASDLPLNTDFVFSGSTDGTATVAGSDTVRDAINILDGWSTNAPFDIAFAGGQIDPATVNTSRVLLLPLESTGDALDPDNINATAPFDLAKVAATAYTVSVVSQDGGTNNVIRIKPTQPLLPKKKYLVVLLNGIKNASGAAITRSAAYDLLASTTPLANAALQPARDAVSGWEALAIGFLSGATGAPPAAIKPTIAMTFSFTTTDPVTPLVGMGGPRAALFSGVSAAVGAANAVAALNGADAAGLLSSPKNRSTGFPTPTATNSFDLAPLSVIAGADVGTLSPGKATLYTGRMTLPYYQTESDGSALTGPVSPSAVPALANRWQGDDRLAAAPPAGLGLPVPTDNDGTTYNTTYRFPFAKPTGLVKVPLQVTLPNPAHTPAGFPAPCGAVAASTGGYPVVIYVHGITSDRSSVIALAHSLADNACTATVAIDLPMHGLAPSNPLWRHLNVERADSSTVTVNGSAGARERHFELAQNALYQAMPMNFGGVADGSGAWFINLANLANTRDNLRQAVMDLLNLNATLATIDADRNGTPDFNTSKVSVVGISLGGMVATTFATVNQSVRATEATANAAISAATGGAVPTAFPVRLNNINGVVASVAGGQLTRILETSRAFGPRILGGLHAAGAVPGTSNFEKFMYVAQSTVDSGDPINFAPTLRELGVPVLVQEIVGGGNVGDGPYPADLVVPNNANAAVTHTYATASGNVNYTTDTYPLAGTDPFISLLGIDNNRTLPRSINMNNVRGAAARLSIGYHTSLLIPDGPAGLPTAGNLLATGELQTQVVSFIATPSTTAFGTAGGNAAANFMTLMTR